MFQKILVPIDLSFQSNAAIQIAAGLASRFEGALTLVYVFDPVPYALPEIPELFSPDQRERLRQDFEKGLASAKRAAEAAGAARVETKLLTGLPAPTIIDFARKNRFELIVIGSHARTGIERMLLGSVAAKVIRMAECPVLTAGPAKEAGAR